MDSSTSSLTKIKVTLTSQLEDAKRVAEDESRQRVNLQAALANLQADYDALAARYEEEAEDAANAKNKCAKYEADFLALKSRYDRDIAAKNDEMEEMRSVHPISCVTYRYIDVGMTPVCLFLQEETDHPHHRAH